MKVRWNRPAGPAAGMAPAMAQDGRGQEGAVATGARLTMLGAPP